ncbi:hypothetical protein BJY04DRAFT_224926 [Aspergillus karnatakaensis]|uniref:uncharacterized protein n=1 Tax=Aspergillus karnatakaensis TaxID=1810916 RepID=UPI003CCDB182
MARSNHQLDRDFEPKEMIAHALSIIRNSSSENGLYPGSLNPTTKEPELFDRELHRDFFFHCGFEIPYILLLIQHEQSLEKRITDEFSGHASSSEQDAVLSKKESIELPKVIEKAIISETGDATLHAEQEWLYKYPDFLNFEPPELSEAKSIITGGRLLLRDRKSDPGDIVVSIGNADEHPARYTFVEDIKF